MLRCLFCPRRNKIAPCHICAPSGSPPTCPWLYTDLPFLDRFEAAARDGFEGVECLFPHEHPQAEVVARLHDLGLELVLFQCQPGQLGGLASGGLAGLPGREADFRASLNAALDLAHALGCPQRARHGRARRRPRRPPGPGQGLGHLRSQPALGRRAGACRRPASSLIEAINPARHARLPADPASSQALALAQNIDSAHLQVQLDLYHAQIVEGDLTMRLRQMLPTGRVGHLQIAAVPDRGEPDAGELNFAWVFDELRRAELDRLDRLRVPPARPRPSLIAPGQATSAGLGWLRTANP